MKDWEILVQYFQINGSKMEQSTVLAVINLSEACG